MYGKNWNINENLSWYCKILNQSCTENYQLDDDENNDNCCNCLEEDIELHV